MPFLDAPAVRAFVAELDEMTPAQRGALDGDIMVLVSTSGSAWRTRNCS